MAAAAPYRAIVAGGAVGRFGRFADLSLAEIAAPVVDEALVSAGVDRAMLQAAFVGNGFGGALQDQEAVLGQILLNAAGIAGLPIHTVKNACSSGSDAVHLGWSAVAFGQYDCVLVLGAEKLSHPERGRTFAALATATDRAPASEGRSVFMDVNAERAEAYMKTYGATARHFALCAAKNRAHAALNEKATVREPITAEAVLADRPVVGPLTRSMCGGICDGAAALVLVSEAFARARGLAGPVVAASAVATGLSAGITDGSAVSGGGNATVRAGAAAFAQAGLAPEDVSLAEVHDPTAPQELFDIEDLGLAPRGGGIALVEAGATSLGGRLPVNVSGGLTSRGHPVGATGVAQIVEIAEQLAGRAGRRQVEGARVGLAQMAGGLLGADSAVATVHILTR